MLGVQGGSCQKVAEFRGNRYALLAKSIGFTAAPEKKPIRGYPAHVRPKHVIQGAEQVPRFHILEKGRKVQKTVDWGYFNRFLAPSEQKIPLTRPQIFFNFLLVFVGGRGWGSLAHVFRNPRARARARPDVPWMCLLSRENGSIMEYFLQILVAEGG